MSIGHVVVTALFLFSFCVNIFLLVKWSIAMETIADMKFHLRSWQKGEDPPKGMDEFLRTH